MKRRDLEALEEVIALRKEHALGRLRPLIAAEEKLQSQLAELVRSQRDLSKKADFSDMRRVGQDVVWLRWIEAKRQEALREMARVRALKAELSVAARKTTAQDLAVRAMRKKLAREASKIRRCPGGQYP